MDTWRITLSLTPRSARLLVTDQEGDERLKARLPIHPEHPRALTTLCEGLALWSGTPLRVALVVADRSGRTDACALFGPDLWPPESALVRFDFRGPPARRRTIAGVGDFRQVRLAHRRSS